MYWKRTKLIEIALLFLSLYFALLTITMSVVTYSGAAASPLRTTAVVLSAFSIFSFALTAEAYAIYEALINVLNRVYRVYQDFRDWQQSASLYELGKLATNTVFVTLGLVIVLIAIVWAFFPDLFQSIPSTDQTVQIENIFGSNIYAQSITLVLNILSVVFLVVIFLIQNANQEYPSQLSQSIFRNPHLLSIYGLVVVVSLFNFTPLFFDMGRPYPFLSYVFSIAAIILIVPLLLFTGHFLDISNVVRYTSDRIIKKISTEKIYRNIETQVYDEGFLEELNSDVQAIVVACMRAIEQGQRIVVQTCLDSLTEIYTQYLRVTSDQAGEDAFLSDFIDKYSFITDEAMDDNLKQKNLVIIVDSIGDNALSVIEHREQIFQSDIIYRWMYQLRSICVESFELRRTSVAYRCVENIEKVTIKALNGGNWKDATSYRGHIKDIGELCSQVNSLYTARVLIRCLDAHFKLFENIYSSTLAGRFVTDVHSVSYLLEEYEELFREAKKNFSSTHLNPVLNSIRLVDGNLAYRMMRLTQQEGLDASEQHRLYEMTKEYIDFIHSLAYIEISKSESGLFLLYPETLIFIVRIQESSPEYRLRLLNELTDCWIRSLSKFLRYLDQARAMRQNDTLSAFSDYYALLLILYGNNDEVLGDTLESLASKYNSQFAHVH